jgi:hypothetical protein
MLFIGYIYIVKKKAWDAADRTGINTSTWRASELTWWRSQRPDGGPWTRFGLKTRWSGASPSRQNVDDVTSTRPRTARWPPGAFEVARWRRHVASWPRRRTQGRRGVKNFHLADCLLRTSAGGGGRGRRLSCSAGTQ